MKIALTISAALLLASFQAQAQNRQIEIVKKHCRDFANKSAPVMIKLVQSYYRLPESERRIPNFRGSEVPTSDPKVYGLLSGTHDYMVHALITSPTLSDSEIATLGYTYCVQRNPY